MKNSKPLDMAPPVTVGVEDTFSYMISDECVGCEACVANCPVHAIAEQRGRLEVDPAICIDCGTCSAVCPTGAARRVPYIRSSISEVNTENCYFNPGCAMNLYKHDGANRMLKLLQDLFGEVKSHNVCCRHSPNFY